MRRLVPLLSLLVLGIAGIARADDGLEEMLEHAAAADFEGRGIVLSSWDGASAATTYQVSRHDGMTMVSGTGVDLMVGAGIMATRSGTEWYALQIGEWSEWALSDRYILSEAATTTRLGRPASEMVVMEAAITRARVVVDVESGVPLLAEIFDGNGRLYRIAALIDFVAASQEAAGMPEGTLMEPSEVPISASAGQLPAEAAWYRRADTYGGPEGTIHAFYTDGLFSFSVFESPRTATPDAFRSAAVLEIDGDAYRRIVAPSQIWVQWHAPDHSYVLVGDLPPDHLEAVLAELPRPGNRGILVRFWRWLFG